MLHGALGTFLIDVAAGVAAAAILAIVTQVIRMSRTVRDTARAASELAEQVAELKRHDEDTRQRLAAIDGGPRRRQAHPPWKGI